MNELLYQMIFKRKSFHTFKGEQKLSKTELEAIEQIMKSLKPLVDDINVAWKIVPRCETTCERGEYCILFYSEKKNYYLYNVGYMLEQLDLWLTSKNIGVCWYGMGEPKEQSYQGLDFVIMFTIEKANEDDFRKDYTKSKRKELSEIWQGNIWQNISSIVRFTPSSCNIQPWLVNANDDKLDIYRILGKRGIIPIDKLSYYNKIDIGIFILFMELCLNHEKIEYKLKLKSDSNEGNENLVATIYLLNKELTKA